MWQTQFVKRGIEALNSFEDNQEVHDISRFNDKFSFMWIAEHFKTADNSINQLEKKFCKCWQMRTFPGQDDFKTNNCFKNLHVSLMEHSNAKMAMPTSQAMFMKTTRCNQSVQKSQWSTMCIVVLSDNATNAAFTLVWLTWWKGGSRPSHVLTWIKNKFCHILFWCLAKNIGCLFLHLLLCVLLQVSSWNCSRCPTDLLIL